MRIQNTHRSLTLTLWVLLLSTVLLSTIAQAQFSDRELRDQTRKIWRISKRDASDDKLNKLLKTNYPNTSVSWKSVVTAVSITDAILQDTRKDKISIALEKVADFAKKQTLNLALKKAGLGFVSDAASWYNSLNGVAIATNKVALGNQVQLYFLARQAGFSKTDIIRKKEEGQNADVSYDDKGWIIGISSRSRPISYAGRPTSIRPIQAWDVADFLWNMKRDSSNFGNAKQKIGAELKKALYEKSYNYSIRQFFGSWSPIDQEPGQNPIYIYHRKGDGDVAILGSHAFKVTLSGEVITFHSTNDRDKPDYSPSKTYGQIKDNGKSIVVNGTIYRKYE